MDAPRLKISLELVVPSSARISPIIVAPSFNVKLLPEPKLLYKAAELVPVAFTVPEMVVMLELPKLLMPLASGPSVLMLPETVVSLSLPKLLMPCEK